MTQQFNTDKLKVVYRVFGEHDVNSFLDHRIEKLANECGLEFVGSGYNFQTKERDLAFEGQLLDLET